MAHPKGLLIEEAQRLGLERPQFNTAKTGPEHEPSFLSDVILEGEVLGTGQGGSKREAERVAAETALAVLSQRSSSGGPQAGKQPATRPAKQQPATAGRGRGGKRSAEAAPAAPSAQEPADEPEEESEDEFTGPWPMFDDLLAGVLQVAEKRVQSDLRGQEALVAIRDFTLALYKDLLADLGEVVEEDYDEDE